MSETPTDPRSAVLGAGAEVERAITTAQTRLDNFIEQEISDLGLTIGEADVLTVILISGDYSLAPSELAEWLSLTTAGIKGRLNSLDSKGLIERRRHESDGRRLTVH